MVAKIQEPKNQLVITLVTLTILLLVWGPFRPIDALDNRITSSSGTWTAQCGITPDGLACLPDQVFVFDPVLMKMVPVPAGREGFATTVINNQIIVTHGSICTAGVCIGGMGVADTPHTRIYDIQKDFHYAVGGRGICDQGGGVIDFGVCKTLEVYDPVKDRLKNTSSLAWTTLPSMPTARAGLAAVVVGHKLYAIGGRTAGHDEHGMVVVEPGTGTALKDLEAYDIAAGTWTAPCETTPPGVPPGLKCMTMKAMDVAAIAHGGKIYVIGGEGEGGVLLNTVQIYDVLSNTWSFGTPMPTAANGESTRANLALAACGNVILALGGRTTSADPTSNTLQSYEIATDNWITCNPTITTPPMPTCLMPTPKSEHGAISQGGVVHVLGSGIFGDPHDNHEALKCSSLFNNK